MMRFTPLLAAATAVLAGGLYAQQHQHAQPQATPGKAAAHGSCDCPMMSGAGSRPNMQHMQKMRAEMQEADARLQQKLETMNKASGNARVDAMAAVINELVAQRRTMHQHMQSMMGMGQAHSGTADRSMPSTGNQAGGDTAGCPAASREEGK